MKTNRIGFGAILLAALIVGGCIYVGSIAIRSLDPFPILEFVDTPGPAATRKMYSWNFTVDPASIRSVSMKEASSIDSYSTWSKFELSQSDAKRLAAEFHTRMATIDAYLQRTKECEQSTRTIASIPVRSPTSDTPGWWSPPTGNGDATENMLWYPDATMVSHRDAILFLMLQMKLSGFTNTLPNTTRSGSAVRVRPMENRRPMIHKNERTMVSNGAAVVRFLVRSKLTLS